MNTTKKLDELLAERGTSLYAFCKTANLQYSAIVGIKRRGSNLSVDVIQQICDCLGIPLFEFFMSDQDWDVFDLYYSAKNRLLNQTPPASKDDDSIFTAGIPYAVKS